MITFDKPITHNKLKTKDDVAQSMIEILKPCGSALINDNTGLFFANNMACYGPKPTLLEGWSRLLWGIAPLRAGGYSWKDQDKHLKGLIEGTNPKAKNYWGDIHYADQRIVEMAAIALSLLITPQYYWDPLTDEQKDNLCTWLNGCNTNEFPHNNWMYFRVLVNLAFEKHNRKEFNESLMMENLDEIEDMYVKDGWYKDYVPFDNYNPWAMQFYCLIYYKFRKNKDADRCKRFEKRVKQFAHQYIYYLNNEGSYIPYGRSLTYRFGALSFFSACAFANIEVLPWGIMKGIVLRNLRWWFKKPIFDREGFLTIGFANPSQIMAEQYNAEGSPYWGLKVYIMLAVEKGHPFWTSKEEPLPKLQKTKLLDVPGIIMQRTDDDDNVMLNAGQYPPFHMMHNAEKYSKFAYSNHYGFSVSSSYCDFPKCGCDSMLYFSDDNEYFRPRRALEILELTEEYTSTKWKPFNDVEVITTLIPAGNFHVRVHKITAGRTVITKEGGFAISRYNGCDIEIDPQEIKDDNSSISVEMPWDVSIIEDPLNNRKASSVLPGSNLNLIASNTIVPYLDGKIQKGESTFYVTLVGAAHNNGKFYSTRPSVKWNEKSSTITINSKSIKLK